MGSYLINFSLYTLAMVGIIFCALFVFKSVMGGKAFAKKSSLVKILDAVKLSPRKTLYVIKAGNERFLVAADTDRTTLISKLADNNSSNILENINAAGLKEDIHTEKIKEEKSFPQEILNKARKYDFLSKPIKIQPKLREEKTEGLNCLYGDDDCVSDSFADELNFRKNNAGKAPMMKEIARKLNF